MASTSEKRSRSPQSAATTTPDPDLDPRKVARIEMDELEANPDARDLRIQLLEEWKTVGPFPAGMREQPFGPSLPNLMETNSAYTVRRPSPESLKPRTEIIDDPDSAEKCSIHTVSLSYPDVDWHSPSRTVGSAALQWQALAYTTLEVYDSDAEQIHQQALIDGGIAPEQWPSPPEDTEGGPNGTCYIQISGAEEFALLGADEWHPENGQPPASTRWYRAQIYDPEGFDDCIDNKLATSTSFQVRKGRYRLVVKSLYEVRTNGLPQAGEAPEVTFEAMVLFYKSGAGHPFAPEQKTLSTCPSVVMGELASPYVTFGVRNLYPNHAIRIISIEETPHKGPVIFESITHEANEDDQVIPPSSLRRITLKLGQSHSVIPPTQKALTFKVRTEQLAPGGYRTGRVESLTFRLHLDHVSFDPTSDSGAYVYTFLSGTQAQYAVVIPPRNLACQGTNVLALHGAGVEADSPMWRRALPRQEDGWVVMPTGMTTWGLDWTMASKKSYEDLLASEFYGPLTDVPPSKDWFVIGHSNGGYGALYALTHDSDRFKGGLIAAGYINMHEYVSSNWQHARNVADPVLLGILNSSQSVFANDLFASHLVDKPITIKYGKDDDNVPPWHSRSLASLISQWSKRAGSTSEYLRLIEVPDRGHWWNGVLSSSDVQRAIDESGKRADPALADRMYMVTTVVPSEMGHVHGIKILSVDVPGRIARVEIDLSEGENISLTTHNTARIIVNLNHYKSLPLRSLIVNGKRWYPEVFDSLVASISGDAVEFHSWQDTDQLERTSGRLLSPVSLFLSAPAIISAVLPLTRATTPGRYEAFKSVAERWAHDLLIYTTLTVRIVRAEDFDSDQLSRGSYVVFMGGYNEHRRRSAISMIEHFPGTDEDSVWEFSVHGQVFGDVGTAVLYSIPHPKNANIDKAMVISGTDLEGIERAGRLLPVRTGLAIPEWIVLGQDADRFGAGGVIGAGWYNNDWDWSPEMSYL